MTADSANSLDMLPAHERSLALMQQRQQKAAARRGLLSCCGLPSKVDIVDDAYLNRRSIELFESLRRSEEESAEAERVEATLAAWASPRPPSPPNGIVPNGTDPMRRSSAPAVLARHARLESTARNGDEEGQARVRLARYRPGLRPSARTLSMRRTSILPCPRVQVELDSAEEAWARRVIGRSIVRKLRRRLERRDRSTWLHISELPASAVPREAPQPLVVGSQVLLHEPDMSLMMGLRVRHPVRGPGVVYHTDAHSIHVEYEGTERSRQHYKEQNWHKLEFVTGSLSVLVATYKRQPLAGTLLEPADDGAWRVQIDGGHAPSVHPAEKLTPLPPFAMDGVSLACIRSFRRQFGARLQGKATAHACEEVVMPLTRRASTSLAACIRSEGLCDSRQNPYVSQATVFCSHAWAYELDLSLDTLEAYAAQQEEPDKVYFWFDLFTNDQHNAPTMPQLWWKTTFQQAIETIGTVCLILSPWRDPRPLTRAWCLWELLCAVRGKSKLHVLLPPSESSSFKLALNEDFDSIIAALSKVDVARAEAWRAADKEMIHGAVSATIGFSDLNTLLIKHLRNWLVEESVAALEEVGAVEGAEQELTSEALAAAAAAGLSESSCGGVGRELERHVSPLCTSVCTLLMELGRYDEATPLAEESFNAHKRRTANTGSTDGGPEALRAEHTLGVLRMKQGRLEDARQILSAVVDRRRTVLGESDTETLESVQALALVLQNLKLPEEAEPLFRLTLAGWRSRQATYVTDARPLRELLVAVNNLASLLRALGGEARLEEAETLLRESLAGKQQLLGPRHPETLIGVNQLGLLLQARARPSEAEPLMREAMQGRREVLGPRHPQTLNAMGNLADLLRQRGRPHEARDVMGDAVGISTEVLGAEHRVTTALQKKQDAVDEAVAEMDRAEAALRQKASYKLRRAMHAITFTSVVSKGAEGNTTHPSLRRPAVSSAHT